MRWVMGGVGMFVIQTGRAKRLRNYARFMAITLLLYGALGALLTLHWYAAPPEK